MTALLWSVLVLVFLVGCDSQGDAPQTPTSTPAPAPPNEVMPRATPTLLARPTAVPLATPTDVPRPIHRTYDVVVKHSCGMSANGVYGTMFDGGISLCFEEPGFFEQSGKIDYFVLLVTQTWSEPRLEVLRYHFLEGVVPTATPIAPVTAGPLPTPNPFVTPSLGANKYATPTTVRTIRVIVDGYCATPTNSVTLDQVNLCFTVPYGRDGQAQIEYWTITVTRGFTPTVRYGLLAWATPQP